MNSSKLKVLHEIIIMADIKNSNGLALNQEQYRIFSEKGITKREVQDAIELNERFGFVECSIVDDNLFVKHCDIEEIDDEELERDLKNLELYDDDKC